MARPDLGATMRVLRPAPHVLAFYDGRIAGLRAWSEAPNWLDDGAFALGACSYAIVDGTEALVYDTHMSLAHAAIVRRVLEEVGVRSIRVVLSHWHADHVAGNAVFQDCPIIASALTGAILVDERDRLEGGFPPIRPLILPTQTFKGSLRLEVGAITVECRSYDIHSRDGTVLLLPDTATLLAGDTLEDPITYVAEPDRLLQHGRDLDRLSRETIDRILPNHGDPAVIERGGFGRGLLDANRRYVAKLLRARGDPALAAEDLRAFLGDDLTDGHVQYCAAYEIVHRRNVDQVIAAEAAA